MDKLQRMAADLPGLLEYAHSVGGFVVAPTSEGAIKSHALRVMQEQAQDKLDQIVEQMRLLAEQAQRLKDRVRISEEIYLAKMTFKPIVGHTYYLYKKRDDQRRVLSMLSPEEWGDSLTFDFYAQVSLLADHTWKVVADRIDR
jgi:hypothetical protein